MEGVVFRLRRKTTPFNHHNSDIKQVIASETKQSQGDNLYNPLILSEKPQIQITIIYPDRNHREILNIYRRYYDAIFKNQKQKNHEI